MKKKREIILTVIITLNIVMSSFISVSSIEEGEMYMYKITEARISAKIGANNYNLKGFKFSGKIYPVGTSVPCLVTNIDQGSIDYNCIIDNKTQINYSASNWISHLDENQMVYTIERTYELIDDWRNYALFSLFFLEIKPYIYPISYNWETIKNLENTLNSNYNHTVAFPNVETFFKKEKNDDIVFLESWIGGELKGLYGDHFDANMNYNSDFSFGNNFHIAFGNSSGLVYGMGYRGWIQGIINDMPVKVSIEYQYTLSGYSMPEYRFGEYHNFLTNNELALIIAIPSSVVLLSASILLGFYIRKKKISKKPDN